MKTVVEVSEFTFSVHGREMTFSEGELIDILEKHFNSKAKTLIEGKCFEVKPKAIDQKLFKKKREDKRQEATRQLIIEAFVELKKNPGRYGKNFKTMIPKKTWSSKTVAELTKKACELGDHMADWVEQALEWAQRIANGETWEAICDDPDTAKWYRVVIWKNGRARLIGGASEEYGFYPASDVNNIDYDSDESINNAVPSVVLYSSTVHCSTKLMAK